MAKVGRNIWVAAVLCTVSVLIAACAGGRGTRAAEPGPEGLTPSAAAEGDADLHLLLLGCDRAASLTDSIQLVSVTPASGEVRILQLPRDTYAAYTERDYRKLNGACNTLGADGTRQWLSEALGVRIDYTAVYGLDCVQRAVDAVGGVELEIPNGGMHYNDPVQGLEIDLPAGCHRLNGTQAEQFIRFRAGYADADLGRLDAQKLFLAAFLRSCRSLSAPELVRVCMAVLPEVKTDLPVGTAVRLALSLLRAEDPVLTAETAPGEAAKGISGAWYYILNRAGMTDALSRWSGKTVTFDPDRLFDRPGNPDFHRIYTAPAAVPSGGIEYGRKQNRNAPDAGRCLSGGAGSRNF